VRVRWVQMEKCVRILVDLECAYSCLLSLLYVQQRNVEQLNVTSFHGPDLHVGDFIEVNFLHDEASRWDHRTLFLSNM
jgi:hypothetical protein